MHDVQIKIVDAPVLELLSAFWLHALFVMEAVPQLGDDEEILSLHNSFFDRSSDTLAAFNFVAIV